MISRILHINCIKSMISETRQSLIEYAEVMGNKNAPII
jgi:hypothetical protein